MKESKILAKNSKTLMKFGNEVLKKIELNLNLSVSAEFYANLSHS